MAAADTLLARELKAAREREADYRARLARHRQLALHLRSHAAGLREALRGLVAGSGSTARLLTDVARRSAEALGIPRTSIWLFDETRRALICRFQLAGAEVTPTGHPRVDVDDVVKDNDQDRRIDVAACPAYVAALLATEVGAVAVNDAWNDPRTMELRDYLARNQVGALLDVPILGPGAVHGVLCHEHQGGARVWQEEEIDFATDVGAMVALALEAERRLLAERTAVGTEAKYQHLVEALPMAVYSFQSGSGQLEYLSPRIAGLGGLGPEQYLVAGGIERWVDSIEPDDREPVRKRLSGSIADGISEELVYRIRGPAGTQRWIRDSCTVVRDAQGRPFAVQGTLADITAQKEAELARDEIERRYRTLLENVDMLAVILSPQGKVEFINDCFVQMSGFSRQEALGADGFDLMLPEADREQVRSDFLKSLAKGKIVPRFESLVQTRTGARRRILWTNTLMRAANGEVLGTSSLGIDITQRAEAEAAQLERQKLESLGRLAATMAHDFNNLLTIIAHAALTDDEPRDERARAARAEINFAIEQGTGLTRSLLAYARHEEIAPVLASIDELVAAMVPMLETLATPRIQLTHELDASEARVVIDRTQLRQVLINLVSNAVDATLGHGGHIRVSTTLVVLEADQARAQGLMAEGTFLLLTVADDGRGMTPDLIERAFDPFFTTKEAGRGTGLGLAMCSSIVRRAGGFIAVDSQPGRGASFRVHLPVASTQPNPTRDTREREARQSEACQREARQSEAREKEPMPPSPTTPPDPSAAAAAPAPAPIVLVVEDNEPIRNLITSVLGARGLRVLDAPDLQTARERLRGAAVDLLLTDGGLPDGHGLDLVRELEQAGGARKVVLMSGSPVDPAQLARLTIHGLVPKPFRVETLVATVLGLLQQGDRDRS
jgi:two-component system cell cycle sensor histidine kinase/response regulator CckA